MSGTINSLGLGSGVLTATLLDQLKAADTSAQITPIDNKITLNQQKGQALNLLSSLLTTYKSSASALNDDALYQKRTVTGGNDGVSVTALSGTQIQDFSLNITNIAKKNVVESTAYTSSTQLIANGTGTLNVGIGSNNYSIGYTATTTLADLRQSINDTAGADVTASILQTGTSAYNLVITSKTTGQAQTITMSDISGQLKDSSLLTPNTRSGTFAAKDDFIASIGTSGTLSVNVGATTANLAYTDTTTLQDLVDNINADTTLNTKVTADIVQYGTNDYRMVLTPKSAEIASAITITDNGTGLLPALTGTTNTAGSMGIIQDSSDAHFTFDGISMTRSTNTITDITYGMTVNLLKDAGSANISITQNRDQIATEMGTMVSNYNTLMKQLGDMTAYDAKAGKVGIFNGDNTIKNISREITKIITSVDSKGYSLPQYGISLDKTGVMSFDKAVFTTKMNADPTGTEGFFSGKTTVTSVGTTKTGSFATASTLISSGASGTMTLQLGSTAYNFAYTNTTTLQQMADSINANSTLTTQLTASVVMIAANDYRMLLTPKNQAVGEPITLSDSTGGGLLSAMTTTISTADVVTATDGVFTSLNTLLDSYTSSSKGLITNLTKASKTESTSLTTQKTKANALLTARYDTLQAKFAAYDSMISKLNQQFAPLLQAINAANKTSG